MTSDLGVRRRPEKVHIHGSIDNETDVSPIKKPGLRTNDRYNIGDGKAMRTPKRMVHRRAAMNFTHQNDTWF
jgi:hypothetical protein